MARRLLYVFVLVSAIALLPGPASAADVVVVKSKDFYVYDQAVEGFRSEFGDKFVTLSIEADQEDPSIIVGKVREHKPQVILAVGLLAAKYLKNGIKDIPIVFCLAVRPDLNGLKTENTTGVYPEPSPKDQLQAFKDTIPRLKRLALPYNPRRWKADNYIEKVQQAASEVGLELLAIPIHDSNEYLKRLPAIADEADAIWLIRDGTVLTMHNFNFSLMVQMQKQLPLLAFGPHFVRKGVVCSFSTGYSEHGAIAARLVRRILDGTSPSEIPIQHPEGTLTINLWSAAKAGVKVPEYILQRPGVVVVDRKESDDKVKDLPKAPSNLDFEE